ncbi:RlpA-like double-psi beta-barrel-protein domain-containing protein-containing protein [Globomyces pollinis-pini]|nr:RlpA-like double-psi beta-barrel-protein domain-containing protein-containing protein [Globomyces pollinis-pini]
MISNVLSLLSLLTLVNAAPIDGSVTYYGPPSERGPFGVGACENNPIDQNYFVAVGASLYDRSRCGQCVAVTYNGRTTVGPVADRCESCGTGVDISQHMMEELGAVGAGRIYSSWEYVPCPGGRGVSFMSRSTVVGSNPSS